MASSPRSPSPIDDVSAPGSPELTPRSKIKALLATVDDSSDDDTSESIDAQALFKSLPNSKPAPTTESPSEDEEDNEEEEIVRPRGRIAARMQENDTTEHQEASRSSEKLPLRVNKLAPASNQQQDAGKNVEDEGEDEEVTAVPRKRRARVVRSATPEDASNSRDRSVSPGLFVSPNPSPQKSTASRHSAAGSDTDDDDLPADLSKSARFQALVARKREERLTKEAEEKRKRNERSKRMADQAPADDSEDDDVSDISDDDGGRKLTQRPTARKASKKAIEEMNRETQRLNRSMQLAHEAKTVKKISKSALFERFNFKAPGAETTVMPDASSNEKIVSSSRPTTPISAPLTDADMGEAGTPPSSPPSAAKKVADASATIAPPQAEEVQQDSVVETDDVMELPSLEDAVEQTRKLDKGKGIATAEDMRSSPTKKAAPAKPKRQVRVKLPAMQVNTAMVDSDDDDGLQILGAKKSKIDKILDRVPKNQTHESRSMHALRQLAHMSSSPPPAGRSRKSMQKPVMTPSELQASLVQRARAQAKLERDRRMDMLKAKGIHVQTAEEREKEREQVEDIVARVRKEAEELMQREREDAKKEKKERRKNGEENPLDWDDSDDESFEGSDDGDAEEPEELELSGSEEGDGDESVEGEDDEQEKAANPLFDEDPEEDDVSEKEEAVQPAENMASDEETDDDLSDIAAKLKSRRPKKHAQIISDDEDEDEDIQATPRPKTVHRKSPSGPYSDSPKVPTSVLRSATKTFIPGLPVPAAGPAGLGLTQIFAGTMDDSQGFAATNGSPAEFMPSSGDFPDSQFSATAGIESQSKDADMIPNSQMGTQKRETQSQGIQLNFEQSQVHGLDSLMRMNDTQTSDWMLEPTQDAGFGENSPLRMRFVEPPQSTVDTVLAGDRNSQVVLESPLVNRKWSKLRRRGDVSVENSNSTLPDTAPIPESPLVNRTAPAPTMREDETQEDGISAFKLMQKAARRKKRLQAKFDKKKSKAHGMVEGEAEESEDEYAGLGGADGEDSSDDEEIAELQKQMIDDEYKMNEADEAKMAGFFADRERKADEARVDKLFRDITTGMLRKRRRGGGDGHEFDLSDDDDDGEARRRLKRRQFAKMQKALFADERIGKIAENPRNAAFLKSIEDRGSDDEWDFDDNFEPEEEKGVSGEESQDQSEKMIPDSQPMATAAAATAANPNVGRKRTRQDPEPAARPAPQLRRTAKDTRASSIADVRRSLSSLLDEPNMSAGSVIPDSLAGSDSEEDDEQEEAQASGSTSSNKENRRTAVVDRIALKRADSSNASGSSNRLAFAAPSAGSSGVFKVPALLRRATTNSLMSTNSSSSTTSSSGGINATTTLHNKNGDDAKLRKNAGKKSGINFFARETERREKMRESERRREEKKWKGAEGRGKIVGGLFGGGQFE